MYHLVVIIIIIIVIIIIVIIVVTPLISASEHCLCVCRCLYHLSEWKKLGILATQVWGNLKAQQHEEIAPILVKASIAGQHRNAAIEYAKYAKWGLEMQLFSIGTFVIVAFVLLRILAEFQGI